MKRLLFFAFAVSIAAAAAAQRVGELWTDRLTLSGDARVRGEYSKTEDDSARTRLRLRARLALDATPIQTVKASIGLASGSSDPRSPIQTFTDAFSKKSVWLDLAYLEWKPAALQGLRLDGGKMRSQFLTVGNLIWDDDVRPEGLFAGYEKTFGSVDLLIGAGGYAIQERHNANQYLQNGQITATDDDTMLYSGQAGLRIRSTETFYILFGGAYYYYANMKGYQTLWDATTGFGNNTVSATNNPLAFYATEFRIMDGMVELGYRCPFTGLPTRLFGDYVKNTEPDSDSTGFMAGVELGRLKDPGSFVLAYDYRKLERDAAPGIFADSESWDGGTDGKGHHVRGAYQMARNWSFGLHLYLDDARISREPKSYRKVQAEIQARF